MKFDEYLETYQPLVYETFKNTLHTGKIAHAYLLSGEHGVPLLETAIFLSKSLLCDDPHPLACNSCRSCTRIDHRTYNDFVVLDGRNGQIKKGDVQEIVGDFTKTPLEAKGIMIYVINLVENMNVQAVNSLLKFLEEPPANTYAFLTCENETKVLPTIISRCEKLRMFLIPKEIVKEQALQAGVKEEDAEILVNFYNNSSLLEEETHEDSYNEMKQLFKSSLETFEKSGDDIVFFFENTVLNALADNKKKSNSFVNAENYLDLLSLAFKDAISLSKGQSILLQSFQTSINNMSRNLPHLEDSLTEILKIRSSLNTNINSSLALMHLILFITEGK